MTNITDRERLDWLERHLVSLVDGGGAWIVEYGPIAEPKRIDAESLDIRQAIDKAMTGTI